MPDINDLHDAFARLEHEIPDGYESPVIRDRMTDLVSRRDRGVRSSRSWTVTATAVLSAAAVIVIAVALVAVAHRGSSSSPVGNQATHGRSTTTGPAPSASPDASPNARPSTSTRHSTSNSAGAMPAGRDALLAYVRGARSVTATDYEQAQPGTGQAMRPTPGVAEFNTPSGNITCAVFGSTATAGDARVTCEAQRASFPVPPKPATCQNDWAGYFGVTVGGQVSVGACVGGPEFGSTTKALAYGSAIELSGIRCRSNTGFLACADLRTGHGFAVNRDVLRRY